MDIKFSLATNITETVFGIVIEHIYPLLQSCLETGALTKGARKPIPPGRGIKALSFSTG
jgi:hypothetical protein